MKPDTTSSLVVSGIYKYTRNPMYLGFLLLLLGVGGIPVESGALFCFRRLFCI